MVAPLSGALAFLALLTTASAIGGPQLPPVQTEAQVQAFERISAAAQPASAAAMADVYTLIGSAAVQSELKRCCPSLAGVAPAELWQRYGTELAVTEISHGFFARNNVTQLNALDLDIDIAMASAWFPNQWQLPLLYHAREMQSYYSLISFLAPAGAMEIEQWGLAPFTGKNPFSPGLWPGGWPASMAEADDRVVYNALNQHRLDFPNSNWGDTAVVFKNGYVRNMTLLTPVDSGDYVCGCDSNFTENFCPHWSNASACGRFWYCHWEGGVCQGGEPGASHSCPMTHRIATGTMAHFGHLLRPFADWYHKGAADGHEAHRVAQLLGRMLLPWDQAPDFTTSDFDYYYEADLLGNPQLPESVNFVLAALPELFGTAAGTKVQHWCASHGWVLIWSLGANYGTNIIDRPPSYAANKRLLDPRSLSNTTATASAPSLTAFSSLWTEAAAARAGSPPGVLTNATFATWWDRLATVSDGELRVQPVRAGVCGTAGHDGEGCVGIADKLGGCVCYRA